MVERFEGGIVESGAVAGDGGSRVIDFGGSNFDALGKGGKNECGEIENVGSGFKKNAAAESAREVGGICDWGAHAGQGARGSGGN